MSTSSSLKPKDIEKLAILLGGSDVSDEPLDFFECTCCGSRFGPFQPDGSKHDAQEEHSDGPNGDCKKTDIRSLQ